MPNKKRILLAEDEEHLLEAIKLNLELEGYKVSTATNGKKALQIFKEERFNLVILDVMMPEIDGFVVAETIRLENSEVPIMFLTAKNTNEDKIAGLKKGADDYLTKPFNLEELILRVNNLVKRGLKGETNKKTIVDLAIPNDTDPAVLEQFPVNFIEVHSLNEVAKSNLQERYQELVHAEKIIEDNIREFIPVLKQRRVEVAMREVPEKIKEIRQKALNSVFADEVQNMDQQSREVLEKIMDYMEKKYISVPMVMAKEILVNGGN